MTTEQEATETREVSKVIGENVKRLRLAKGISQVRLALEHQNYCRRIGLPATMTRIIVAATESDDRAVKADELPGFCAVLGVDLETLMGRSVPGRNRMFPQQGRRPDVSLFADPDRLVDFLVERITPEIAARVERQVEERMEPMVREVMVKAIGRA